MLEEYLPPRAAERRPPSEPPVQRVGLGSWRFDGEGQGTCRLVAGNGPVTLAIGSRGENGARVALRIGERQSRFRKGSRYTLRAGRTSVPLSAASVQEPNWPVPATLAGSRAVLGIASAKALQVTGPGLRLTLTAAPDPQTTKAFVSCIEAAAPAPARPRPPTAVERGDGGWEVVRRTDACSIHRLGGPIGVSVASVRGAGLAVTLHGRGAFEEGRDYTVRFSGAGAPWSLKANAVNRDTLVWSMPSGPAGRGRVADLLLGGSVAVPELESLAPTRLPPAGSLAESFLQCGREVFGSPPSEAAAPSDSTEDQAPS